MDNSTQPEGLVRAMSLAFREARLGLTLKERIDAVARPLGLSGEQLLLLDFLAQPLWEIKRERFWVRFQELQRLLVMSPSAVGHQLRDLVDKKLCQKTKDPKVAGSMDTSLDKRATWYSVTPYGMKFWSLNKRGLVDLEDVLAARAYGYNTQQPSHWINSCYSKLTKTPGKVYPVVFVKPPEDDEPPASPESEA